MISHARVMLVCALLMSSCAVEDDDDLAGANQALEPDDLGPIQVAPAGTKANLALEQASTKDDGASKTWSELVVEDDLVTKRRRRVRIADKWRNSPSALTNSTPNGPVPQASDSAPPATANDSTVDKGWSGGVDNRSDRTNAYQVYYDYIARVGTGCTATMVGQTAAGTFALTAAHCVYSNTGSTIATTVEPAAGAASRTRGLWNVTGVTRYDSWISNACYAGSSQADTCRRYDIALLRLSPAAGTTFIGSMSYATRTTAQIASATRIHRGYAGCGGVGAPSFCTAGHLYGDNFVSTVGSYRQSDRLFDHSSDINPGHSGGPIYYDNGLGGNGTWTVYAVQSGEWCAGACTGNSHQATPNIGVRITQDWVDTMNSKLFP